MKLIQISNGLTVSRDRARDELILTFKNNSNFHPHNLWIAFHLFVFRLEFILLFDIWRFGDSLRSIGNGSVLYMDENRRHID